MSDKKNCGTRIWVHPDFRRKLRTLAGESDMSLLDLTETLARKNEKKKKKPEFEFKF